jgi:hypothetical protein
MSSIRPTFLTKYWNRKRLYAAPEWRRGLDQPAPSAR